MRRFSAGPHAYQPVPQPPTLQSDGAGAQVDAAHIAVGPFGIATSNSKLPPVLEDASYGGHKIPGSNGQDNDDDDNCDDNDEEDDADDLEAAWAHDRTRKARTNYCWTTHVAAAVQRSPLTVLVLTFVAGMIVAWAAYTTMRWSTSRSPSSTLPANDTIDEATNEPSLDLDEHSSPRKSFDPEFQNYIPKDSPFLLHLVGDDNDKVTVMPPSCPFPLVYTDEAHVAEAILFNTDRGHRPSMEERREWRKTRPWQKHYVTGAEAAPQRSALQDYFEQVYEGLPPEERYADGDMTCQLRQALLEQTLWREIRCLLPPLAIIADRLNGTVPQTYSYTYINYSLPIVPYEQKKQDKPVLSFVSNCFPRNSRTLILDELLALMPGQIDSFGRCRGNGNAKQMLSDMGRLDAIDQPETWWTVKTAVTQFYKFTLAMENSNDLDYVTEKYYQCLERGSVPIVYGAPNFAERFSIAPNSFINVADYVTPDLMALSKTTSSPEEALSQENKDGIKRLVERIQYLSSPEGRTEYDAMLAWKKDESWKDTSPMGKIYKMSHRKIHNHCMIAGVARGYDWAKSTWTPAPSAEALESLKFKQKKLWRWKSMIAKDN
ncbi:BQ2448_5692 [Microbotryum intermedium]|uniref:Fucosyltransferase n=1 Tax=Microbotryum intermedium TaxID=269621 RepID=A0A238F7H4_9BASI|nr:BQ2448_5692 [Microbotryum intermedium]